jgi:hypothetical protein
MAQRKEDLSHNKHQAAPTTKRSRITIDISPELRRRIKLAALQHDLSIGEYVGDILEETVPKEENTIPPERRPVTREAFERLMKFREKLLKETKGELFDDSVEILRQQREERTRQLMGEL